MNIQTNQKYENSNMQIINPNPICSEGAMRLAAVILKATYNDYVNALTAIMKCHKEHKRCDWAIRTKIKCELFYKSKQFVIYTLGKSKPGEEVIKDIQERVGYVEEVN